MKFKKNKKFKSISKHLLRVVFTFYFSITIIMTLVHFYIEYLHTEDSVKVELKLIADTFKKSLENALWDLNTKQVESISNGALTLPSVLGVKIFDENINTMIYEKYLNGIDPDTDKTFYFELKLFYDQNGNKTYVGTVRYYSSSNVVFDRVKVGFFIIFLNSLFKSLILTILFIWAFNKFLTRPLEDITSNIERLDLHNIKEHKPLAVDEGKSDELTFLARAFNNMLKNIDDKLKVIKETQKHLLESEKMVSLGGMVAGVSHEINTPVGMALTGVTHLEEETKRIKSLYENDDMSQEDFEEYLKDVHSISISAHINLNKAASLINSFKKVAVDQSSEELREINLKGYINEVLLSLHNHLKKTKIEILLDIDENLNIYSHPGAISQVITNLIMNSLIHGFENSNTKEGKIVIKAALSDKNITLIYNDTGKGMGKHTSKKIFDPFFTTKRSQGGSGLGMSIVYNLVTSSLNGSIEVKSEPDRGVEFKIVFPYKKKEEV